jgi:phosphoribosylaminoimidazole-succinocarboxamide synthase
MTVLQTNVADYPVRRGKVRDVYDLGDGRLAIVATDRISAFDVVLPSGIPNKGKVLTAMTRFWIDLLGGIVPTHFLSDDVNEMPDPFKAEEFVGRTMLVEKGEPLPVECIVRGYITGSAWKEYQKSGTVCDIPIKKGLKESDLIGETLFTPSTKAEQGHDENISFARMVEILGDEDLAWEIDAVAQKLYFKALKYARGCGIIIADTKFEFGLSGPADVSPKRRLMLIDEVLTPDSSRFWPMDQYEPGRGQPSFDKQYVRDWLEQSGWDKKSAPPALPEEVVLATSKKYIQIYEMLSGRKFKE